VAIARKKHAAGIFFAARPPSKPAPTPPARAERAAWRRTPRARASVAVVSRPRLGARSLSRARENDAARSAGRRRAVGGTTPRSTGRRRRGAPAAPRVQFSLALPARVGKLTKEFASIGGENLTGVEEE